MKITIYECDKCHKRFEEDDNSIAEVFGIADLCDKCFEKAHNLFIDWLEGKGKCEDGGVPIDIDKYPKKEEMPETLKEEKPVIKEKPKSKIDWNKACALKAAGWSHKNIADELGIEQGTLNSGTFYKKIEQYKQGIRF